MPDHFSYLYDDLGGTRKRGATDEDGKLRTTRPPILDKKQRNEAPKELVVSSTATTSQRPSLADKEDSSRTPSGFMDTTE